MNAQPDEPLQDEPLPEKDPVEPVFGLSDEQIGDITETLHSRYEDAVVEKIAALSPADAAELISKIGEEDRTLLMSRHSAAFDPRAFAELSPELRKDVLSGMPPIQVASLISELDSDDALNLIVNLEPLFQKEVIRKLSLKTRITLREGLNFPEDSAGRLMQREFVAIPQFWTVGKTIDYLRAAATELPEDFFDLFVITPAYKVAGQIPLSRIVRAQRTEKLENLTIDDTHPITATMDQEEVAQIFQRENLTSAPVTDESERLIGVITVDDIVDVIKEEAGEDLLKISGVGPDDLYSAALSTTGMRFRWLFLNLLTALLASGVISLFGATLEQSVALAILMPIVASMGGNAGTQTLAVAVRALATRELSYANVYRIVWKETLVGLMNGAGFAVITGATTSLWFHDTVLGAVIGLAMAINLICAGFAGVTIPAILHRLGSDPAVSSAVFLTTVTDIVGFFTFLGLATIFLVH